MGELEDLKAKLAKYEEIKAQKNPKCARCEKVLKDEFYRCNIHLTVFCKECLLIPVKDKEGNVRAKDQAHCKQHYMFQQDCMYERIKQNAD